LNLNAITDLSLLTKTTLAHATNFEVLELSGAIATAATPAKGTLDLSGLPSGMTTVALNTSTATEDIILANAGATANLTYLASFNHNVTVNPATGLTNVLNVAIGDGTNAALDEATASLLTANGFVTLNIASNGSTSTGAVTNKLKVSLADATTINITGNGGVDLTGSTLTKVATVDGHTSTGNITVTTSVTTGVTISTGSGDDTIVGSAAAKAGAVAAKVDTISAGDGFNTITEAHGNNVITAGAGHNVIVAGDGNNTITLGTIKAGAASTVGITGGNNTIVSGDVTGTGHITVTETVAGGNNTITLGGGAADSVVVLGGNNTITVGNGAGDAVTVGAGVNTVNLGTGAGDIVNITGPSAAAGTFTTVNGIASSDILHFTAVTTNAGVLGAAVTSGVADFFTLTNAASAGAVAGHVSWFQFGGDTYVVEDNNAAGTFTAGSDVIIKLAGIHDLSHAVAAGNTITLA